MQLPAIAIDRRYPNHARQRAWDLNDREAGIASEGVHALELDDEVQTLVLDPRKRPRRVEGERRQYRLHLAFEVALEDCRLGARDALRPQQADARLGQCGRDFVVEDPVLVGDQRACPSVNRLQLLGNRTPVRPHRDRAALQALLEAGDTDLEEFVEVARADGQEAQALEQRQGRVLGQVQNPLIELEK
jgi:hypothetical protein